MQTELLEFQKKQKAFAEYLRNPDRAPMPTDMNPDRAQLYKNLYFNNIEELLSRTLPLTREHLDEKTWHAIVREFFGSYPHVTPYFMDIAGEFVQFLSGPRDVHPSEPAYVLELAHYEWVELALSVDNTPEPEEIDPAKSLLDGIPILVPASAVLAYEYPVHRLTPSSPPEPTFLLLYRDSADEMQFVELAPAAAQLLESAKNNSELSGEALIRQVAITFGQSEDESFLAAARQSLQDMHDRGVIPGAK